MYVTTVETDDNYVTMLVCSYFKYKFEYTQNFIIFWLIKNLFQLYIIFLFLYN